MRKRKSVKILQGTAAVLMLVFFFALSNWLAPLAAGAADFNHYYILSWGAPALFHEDIDDMGALLKLEPWRLLGLQLPAFAGIEPSDWQEAVTPPYDIPVNPPSDDPGISMGTVGIYHTHASEAFVPTSGQARSTDFSETVVELGRIIKEILEENGVPVVHCSEYHDREYSKSYVNSRQSAQDMLNQESDIMLLLDLHRDGVGETSSAGRAVTTATIDGKQAGQIMFVISSAHQNWERNNRIANDLHNLMEDKYPGLSRGILSRRNSAYNQDLHTGALLVEIGGHWNSMDEAVYGAELFAEILLDYIGGIQ